MARTLISPTGKDKAIGPVRPSAAVQHAYYSRIIALVQDMSEQINRSIEAAYKRAQPQIAQDESSLARLKREVAEMTRRWQDAFDDKAKPIADRFVKQTYGHTVSTAQKRMRAAGLMIKFKPSQRTRQIMSAAIAENTKLIKSIASEYLDDVNSVVNRGIMGGYDHARIIKELKHRYGVTQRRAAFISRQEASNATADLNKARDLDSGIEEGIWVHVDGQLHPRTSHLQAGRERRRFSLSEGLELDGKRTWPGKEFNCSCYYIPIIPGFNG